MELGCGTRASSSGNRTAFSWPFGPVVRLAHQAGLEHRLGELLDEQRHAVGLGDDLVTHQRRQRLAADDPFDQRLGLALRQAGEVDLTDVGAAGPGQRELGRQV